MALYLCEACSSCALSIFWRLFGRSMASMSMLLLVLCLVFSALLLAIPAAGHFQQPVSAEDSLNCVYTIYVRTGSIFKGGTDSNIGVQLYDAYNNSAIVDNLEIWGGLMPSGWNYFERGNLDVFSGRGSCLASSPCKLIVTSDGSGSHHGWYLNYVEVTITGPHLGCAQTLFTVEQWLALDTSPYKLNATVEKCSDSRRSSQLKLARSA